jgi:hypothetical protein
MRRLILAGSVVLAIPLTLSSSSAVAAGPLGSRSDTGVLVASGPVTDLGQRRITHTVVRDPVPSASYSAVGVSRRGEVFFRIEAGGNRPVSIVSIDIVSGLSSPVANIPPTAEGRDPGPNLGFGRPIKSITETARGDLIVLEDYSVDFSSQVHKINKDRSSLVTLGSFRDVQNVGSGFPVLFSDGGEGFWISGASPSHYDEFGKLIETVTCSSPGPCGLWYGRQPSGALIGFGWDSRILRRDPDGTIKVILTYPQSYPDGTNVGWGSFPYLDGQLVTYSATDDGEPREIHFANEAGLTRVAGSTSFGVEPSGFGGPAIGASVGSMQPVGILPNGAVVLAHASGRDGKRAFVPEFLTIGGPFALSGGETLALQVTGRAGVPADAVAVSMNVTAVGPGEGGFITVYPCGQLRPEASNLNYVSGSVVANLVTVRPGVGGKVCIYSSATSGLLADVAGYFAAGSSFVPVNNPERILDTRTGLS